MTIVTSSPNNALSRCDGIAAAATDVWLLIGRVGLGWIFAILGWGKLTGIGAFQGYLTNLKVPAPELMAWVAASAEFLLGVLLIVGLATRYAAVLGVVFVAIATALAHRYWEFPMPAQIGQFSNFLKNLAIMGGMFYVFVAGPGRFSADSMIAKR